MEEKKTSQAHPSPQPTPRPLERQEEELADRCAKLPFLQGRQAFFLMRRVSHFRSWGMHVLTRMKLSPSTLRDSVNQARQRPNPAAQARGLSTAGSGAGKLQQILDNIRRELDLSGDGPSHGADAVIATPLDHVCYSVSQTLTYRKLWALYSLEYHVAFHLLQDSDTMDLLQRLLEILINKDWTKTTGIVRFLELENHSVYARNAEREQYAITPAYTLEDYY